MLVADLILQQRDATKKWPRRSQHLVFLISQIQESHPTETIGEPTRHQRKDPGDDRVKANNIRNIIFEFV